MSPGALGATAAREDDILESSTRPPIKLNAIADETVLRAAAIVNASGIVEQVEAWKDEDRRGPGGRPETFPLRALVVAMVLSAVLDEPMLATSFTDLLFRRISLAMRHALGVLEPPGPLSARRAEALYRTVRTRLHGLLDVMDSSPLPKNRRHNHDEFEAAVELLQCRRSEKERQIFNDRLTWFTNAVLEASLKMVPRHVRRRWKGSVAVDAPVVPAFARAERRAQGTGKAASRPILKHSADPDAAWYSREAGTEGDSRAVWGYELTIAVSGSDDPKGSEPFPSLVVGMAPLHKPSHDPGKNAIVALASVRDRGHPARLVAGDKAYSNQRPEHFQLPARALGYGLVLDYKSDQLGVQAEYRGMLQIEGEWYCPAIREPLINATIDHMVNKTIDDTTYRARLRERWNYRVVTKAGPDAEGHVRKRCPATDPSPMVRCELKPKSDRPSTQGKTRVLLGADVRDHPPVICTQQSITVPPAAGAKFAQELLYGGDEWHAAYATLRNSIEGMNGYVKDGAHEALDDPQRRRTRGVAAQSVLVAFLLMAANLRKIGSFLAVEAALVADKVRTLPRRRRTRSIETWRPTGGVVVPGPDPPLTV